MKLTIYLPAIVLLLAMYDGCSSPKDQKNDDSIPVHIIELKKEDVHKTIHVSGVFTTNDETYLSFKTGGIVKSIIVNEGDRVTKGEVLAVLELNEIQAQVSQATAGYEKALRDYNRVQNLYADSVATLAQMQDAKTGLSVAAEQLTIARYNLNHSEIRAIDDGYILKKFVNEGQLVSPGMSVFQTNGPEKNGWILKAGISDRDWSVVQIGDTAVVQSDINPSLNIQASIVRKSGGVDSYSGTFFVEVKIKTTHAGALASGMFGKAEIFPRYRDKMWSAPYSSILDGDGTMGYVFVTDDMKTAKKKEIHIFAMEKNNVYIDSGLDQWKYLITTGSAYLTDNSSIKIDR
jgi:RND family efflux transporter MFP subunit